MLGKNTLSASPPLNHLKTSYPLTTPLSQHSTPSPTPTAQPAWSPVPTCGHQTAALPAPKRSPWNVPQAQQSTSLEQSGTAAAGTAPQVHGWVLRYSTVSRTSDLSRIRYWRLILGGWRRFRRGSCRWWRIGRIRLLLVMVSCHCILFEIIVVFVLKLFFVFACKMERGELSNIIYLNSRRYESD